MNFIVLSIVALTVSAGEPAAPKGSAEAGKTLFAAKCASCHAKDAKGNPAMAKMFKADPAALDLTKADMKGQTDAEIIATLSKGKNKMPAFGDKLKAGEIADVVAYIRSLGSPAQGKKAPVAK